MNLIYKLETRRVSRMSKQFTPIREWEGRHIVTAADQVILDANEGDDIYIVVDGDDNPTGVELITPPLVVPQVVAAWRIKAIAELQDLRVNINLAIASISDPQTKIVARVSWNEGNEIRRDSALIISMGAGLGLSEDDLDGMFIAAAALEV